MREERLKNRFRSYGRRSARLYVVVCALAAASSAARASAAEVPALRVLASYEVAGEPSTATDVRWAGDRSVYLARRYHGVAEVKLEAGLQRVRQVVPSPASLGFRSSQSFDQLAASEDFLAVADSLGFVAWRSLERRADLSVRFDRKTMWSVEDLDLAGDRLLVLGAIRYDDPRNPFSLDGAVAFLGSAREDGRQTLRPVLFDPEGRGAPHLLHCVGESLGSARFLAGGSFFIVPGFQPGAYLFSPEGQVVHTWNTALLGLDEDADCARRTLKTRNALNADSERLFQHLNQHRIVDEVLPLPSGPGLVIRSVEAGTVRWELDVLGAGGIETYEIPLPSASAYVRASGDVRAGKIVLLVADRRVEAPGRKAASRLVVLAAPGR